MDFNKWFSFILLKIVFLPRWLYVQIKHYHISVCNLFIHFLLSFHFFIFVDTHSQTEVQMNYN